MTKEELITLLERYDTGACTPQEVARLEQWFINRYKTRDWQWENEHERQLAKRTMQAYLENELFPRRRTSVFTLKRIAVAASVLVCCAAAWWLYFGRYSPSVSKDFYAEQAVNPGSNAARLTLSDGTTLWLDDTQSGTLYDENGIAITKLADGDLQYDVNEQLLTATGEPHTNTISIPRGGQYRLTLPDGTRVWLNSATTLVYPVVFVGKERKVSLVGEAYFEVAKNEHLPFRVETGDTEVLVTGTHFNVAAYSDENWVATTLVEGGVRVSKGKQTVTLAPGQQAVTTTANTAIKTKAVDTDFALAWVNGDFLFEDQDIQTIMRDIARWYNVDVRFEGPPGTNTFGGTFARSKGLAELLDHLSSLSGMRFTLKGRKVTVMK